MLWNDFGYAWENLNHRVAYLRAGASPAGEGEVRAELGIIGGPWSSGDVLFDAPSYHLGWTTVNSRHLVAAYYTTELTIGPSGVASEAVTVPLSDVRKEAFYAVGIAGVDFVTDVPQADDYPDETYDPAHGWVPQGFGVDVAPGSLTADTLEVTVAAHFKPGLLERPGEFGDRPDMNAASPFATVGATVRWYVLAPSKATWAETSVDVYAYYEVDPPRTPHPPIDEALREATIQGRPGPAVGVPVVAAWDFVLSESLDEEGRYLRAFSAGIESWDYDAEAGTADVLFDAYCSIESQLEEGDLEVRFTATAGLLQIDDDDAVVTPGFVSGTSDDTGEFDRVVAVE